VVFPKLENVILPGRGPMHLVDVSAGLASAVVTWPELKWIRDLWRGPIVIKGILSPEDARRAVDEGAAAIVVSNHGGRQLDGVQASIQALPEVVSAVGGQVDVLMNGGVRRGSDVVKAICLGARGILIGRAYGYGLGRLARSVFPAPSKFCVRGWSVLGAYSAAPRSLSLTRRWLVVPLHGKLLLHRDPRFVLPPVFSAISDAGFN